MSRRRSDPMEAIEMNQAPIHVTIEKKGVGCLGITMILLIGLLLGFLVTCGGCISVLF